MADYFPRQSIAWKVEEAAAFRALSLSAVEFGLLTGVVLRLARAIALGHGPSGPFVLIELTILAVSTVLLLGAVAAHLANYPIRRWLWRAPYFAVMEVVGEMATSALLLVFHRERWGSARANWGDWPSMALETLVLRLVEVCVFALLLAGVVYLVRRTLVRRERRESVREGEGGRAHEGSRR
jgi:hypothetical protein